MRAVWSCSRGSRQGWRRQSASSLRGVTDEACQGCSITPVLRLDGQGAQPASKTCTDFGGPARLCKAEGEGKGGREDRAGVHLFCSLFFFLMEWSGERKGWRKRREVLWTGYGRPGKDNVNMLRRREIDNFESRVRRPVWLWRRRAED